MTQPSKTRRHVLSLLALWFAAGCACAQSLAPSPQALFGELFAAVQMQQVFADSKLFADATPKTAPSDILAAYRRQAPQSREELRRFVEANFYLPSDIAAAPEASASNSIREHIDALWAPLTRSAVDAPAYSSLLPLPRPYVVPGGRFREMYYWDSYFTMLGLVESGRRDLVEDMVRNFAHFIDVYGHIPNGARTYYLSRSQPPFFFKMLGLLARDDPAAAYAQYLPQLKKEYDFWMAGEEDVAPGQASRRVVALAKGVVLNRYWDDSDAPRDESYREDVVLAQKTPRESRQLFRDLRAAAESGWDFSSRWFADGETLASIQTTEIVPIDLNSLLFGLEQAIRLGCERTADRDCARAFARRADARRFAVNRYLWDAAVGAYVDYRWTDEKRLARVSAATLYPLFTELATRRRAAIVARTVERQLLKTGGVATSSVNTTQQWDAPNGWAPLQWIAVAGLRRYGHEPLAAQIACRWTTVVSRVYAQTGKLMEKYDVVTPERPGGGGEYPLQDGFGWTNGVMLKLLALYPQEVEAATPEACAAPLRSR